MTNSIIFLVLAVAFLYMSGFFNRFLVSAAGPEEAKNLLATNSATLIDVREKDEVEQGMIDGALWIPLSSLTSMDEATKQKLAKITKDKPLLLYCRSGNRSARAALILNEMGYTSKNIGGFQKLLNSGFKSSAGNLVTE